MNKQISQLLQHWSRFGVVRGTRIVWLKSRKRFSERNLPAPGNERTIVVRTGGSDMAIYDEVVLSTYLPELDIASGSWILDIGANIGLVSNLFRYQYPDNPILAVEPDPANYGLLVRNTSALDNITTVHAGLAPKDSRLSVDRSGKNSSGYQTISSDNGEITGLSMNTLLSEHGIDRIGLVKIDIEGFELELFRDGETSWIDRCDHIAIEPHDRLKTGCTSAFLSALILPDWSITIQGQMLLASRIQPLG